MIRSVLFDFDGTIADTFQSAIETINFLANKYGYERIEKGEIEELRAKSMREILKKHKIFLLKVPNILKEFTILSQKKMSHQHPYCKMVEQLNKLKRSGYGLNIITSNSVVNVSIFLKKHNLNVFDHIYSDKSLFGKGVIISRFLLKYQIKKKEAIYIGDEIRDIEAARKAKIKIISVAWGFNSKEALKENNPDYLIDKPEQIAETLKIIDTSSG